MHETRLTPMPRSHATLYLAATGMITPVGADTVCTATAVRARLGAQRITEYRNKDLEPMILAQVPDAALPPLKASLDRLAGVSGRHRRLLQLAAPALQQVLSSYPNAGHPLALFLAGPETLPGCPTALNGAFVDHLMVQTGITLQRDNCRVLDTGRAGGVHVIELAFRYLEETQHDYVVVGGVESFRDRFVLGHLDTEDRVLSPSRKDAAVPGEAAGFLLLATQEGMARFGQTPLCTVSRPGWAREPGHLYSTEPYRGEGLANAWTQALDRIPGKTIRTVYSSMNGEHFWAKEHGVAMTRCHARLDENVVHEHPGDSLGDIGAAFGPVMVGLAAIGMQRRYINGPALVYGSCDQEHRAAVCVHSTDS